MIPLFLFGSAKALRGLCLPFEGEFEIAAAAAAPAPRGADRRESEAEDKRAILVATAVRANEDPQNYMKDWSVAEGARVKLTDAQGKVREKATEPFVRETEGASGTTYYTADFEIELDASYEVEIALKDGVVLRVEDLNLPSAWRHHFLYHSTIGLKSPASIMRSATDEKTNVRFCVYGLHPVENYHALGGRQIP